MITAAAGDNVALVFEAGAVLTSPTVTIAPTAGGAAVVGPTSDGLGVDGTTYTYVWQVSSSQAQASYTATLEGTSGGDPVEVEIEVYVTALPVYATLADLKSMITVTDSTRDSLLASKLAAASRSIDKTCGRRFWLDTTATARTINPGRRVVVDEDGSHLLVPDIGDTDGMIVEVGRGGTWTDITSQVEAEPTDALDQLEPVTSLLRIGGSWPTGAGWRARVTTRWGFPAYPDVVVEGTRILAARLFKRKDSPEGVLGSSEWGVIRLSRTDPDVYGLIQSYILTGLA
ncbi:phage head-tail connector protein [Streptomyces sp. NPDC018693]|uniref:phage head-tail connector protein n=1 Tax=unclassified Streptomyces TaxID=2593676 RepID=UPI0037A71EB9